MLKKIGQEVGFDIVAVTNADPLLAAREFLKECARVGYHADMDWLTRDIDKRISPKKILPGAESVIMLAKNYFSEDGPGEGGYVAKYARFRDYHREITAQIKKMLRVLQEKFPEHTFKHYVDYGPLLEKGFALKTGMGVIGKNTTLITKEFGSWVLLSEIISTVPVSEFKHKNPERTYDNCGACTKCIVACPTGALVKPYIMDARKCISYLTIENKQGIALELRHKIGGHLFGCDICQKVCPFNEAIEVKEASENWERRNPAEIHPNDILGMRYEEQFKKRFAGTPLMRPKFRGMLRNACVVAGNLGLKDCEDNLRYWHYQDDKMIAEHAGWALERISKEN